MFDKFSICEAYYTFASLYHGGMGSEVYSYLGRLDKIGFKPGLSSGRPERLDEEAKEVYGRLLAKHGFKAGFYLASERLGFTLTDIETDEEVFFQSDWDQAALASHLGWRGDPDRNVAAGVRWLEDNAGQVFYHDLSWYFASDSDDSDAIAAE